MRAGRLKIGCSVFCPPILKIYVLVSSIGDKFTALLTIREGRQP